MQTQRDITRNVRNYHLQLAAAGEQEVMFRLSNQTVAVIDGLKQHLGQRNHGQVLEQFFGQRSEAAQQ